jgi:hypothetical protein
MCQQLQSVTRALCAPYACFRQALYSMANAILRITGASAHFEPLRARLPTVILDRGDIVVRSALSDAASLNEHLVWLWGMLNHERRMLKRLQAGGAHFSCVASVGKEPIRLLPNGAEMLHLLQCELIVERK